MLIETAEEIMQDEAVRIQEWQIPGIPDLESKEIITGVRRSLPGKKEIPMLVEAL